MSETQTQLSIDFDAAPVANTTDREARIARWKAHRERRVSKLKYLAEKSREESTALFNSQNIKILRGMMGEPIKIGHHSERRHRKLIEKADRDMGNACRAYEKSKHYERAAYVAELNDVIDGRDPEALPKLREKLDRLREKQESMKAINAAFRKGTLADIGFTPEQIAEVQAKVDKAYSWEKAGPFPGYTLTNNNANIKRVEERIKILERKKARGVADDVILEGLTIRENQDYDSTELWFEGKPAPEIISFLKMNGFRWVRSQGCWSRRRSSVTDSHVGRLRERLGV